MRGHEEGEALPVRRPRVSHAAWIRTQELDFDEVVNRELETVDHLDDLGPASFRAVDCRPVDPAEVGHIQLDRWIIGNGDGYEALGVAFNVPMPTQMLDEYLAQHLADYRRIYPANEQHMLDFALECFDMGMEMVDDIVQFMVDATQVAMILCQDYGGRYEVTTLLPRFTQPGRLRISSRCLIVSDGAWSSQCNSSASL
uniref:Uncharacterized protein n=1 Tax=Kalmanozyma brasiliensis (strain GHG001) TaxID=1365824 RepID=V5EV98_KALBG